MTTYIVHRYREMRLSYAGIEAESPEAAAAIAGGKLTADADNIEDCEGQNLAALVDIAGDEDYSQSVTIDFEGERICKSAPALLAIVKAVAELRRKWRSQEVSETIDSIEFMDGLDALELDTTIAEATAAGISSVSITAAPNLLASLEATLPHAENEAYSLDKHKDSPEAEAEAEKAWLAVEAAKGAIAHARVSGIAPADPDIHSLLAARREIAVVWGIEDVQEIRPDLSDAQAWEALQAARRYHDANIGINWNVLDCHADMLFGPAPETEETEEA